MFHQIDYYRDERVIKRLMEYCGVPFNLTNNFRLSENYQRYNLSDKLLNHSEIADISYAMTAEYLVGSGKYLLETRNKEFESVKNFSLAWLLDNGLDLFRSIWDKTNTLGILDVEYFSKQYPGAAYAEPESIYSKLEPFHNCLMNVFFHFGFNPLVIATGQGYHYVFRVHNSSHVAEKLLEFGHVEDTTLAKYLYPQDKRDRIVSLEEGKRFDAMGKLLEYIVHIAIQNKDNFDVYLPVTIGDIAVGNNLQEAINVDLSCYANPLFMRDIRLPFSTHQKHKMYPRKVGKYISENIPVQIAIPRYTPCNGNQLSLEELFKNRRHFQNSANYAGAITTEIPECSYGVENLIENYKSSELYRFHRYFDYSPNEDPSNWKWTYDRFDLQFLPPCIANILEHPNPYLLQPTQIQTLVRTLFSKGWWEPKHVAGLIRSKYERDYGWEINWLHYDANMWACVWTRFYAGLIADGTDQKTDFNCRSHQEKGIAWAGQSYCVNPYCNYNLADYA